MTELPADEGVQDGAELEEVMKTALATGRTYAEVGVLVRRSARTVRRRMSDPQFAADVSARRGEHVSALTGQLVSGGSDAVAVLLQCLTSGSDPVRLRAAQSVLSLGTQMRQSGELEERLSALESRTPAATSGRTA